MYVKFHLAVELFGGIDTGGIVTDLGCNLVKCLYSGNTAVNNYSAESVHSTSSSSSAGWSAPIE